MTIQAIGQVKAQIPDSSLRPLSTTPIRLATPARMTNSGQAWPQLSSAARWTRKMTPSPMSQVAPINDPRRALVIGMTSRGPRS